MITLAPMSPLSWFKVCTCVCSHTALFALDTAPQCACLEKPLIIPPLSSLSYPPQRPMTLYYHCNKAGSHRCNLKPTASLITDTIYKMVMSLCTVQNTNFAISPFAIGCACMKKWHNYASECSWSECSGGKSPHQR